jgi:cytochrome oxidase Cu insertion factor (SCO1/SenC/PrrC family)
MISRLLCIRWAAAAALAIAASLGGLAWKARHASGPAGDREPSCCTITGPESADPGARITDEAAAIAPRRALTIPDTPMVNHNGRPVRFYSDLVKGRVVAIDFIFTRCQTICPSLSVVFGQLQRLLGDRPVHLISVSIDPVNDKPAQLAEWARRFGAGPNWSLVTGEKPDVDGLLKALGGFVADKNSHSPLVLVGDDRTGTWRRLAGITPAEQIKDAIASVARKGDQAPAGPDATEVADTPARRYFTDVPLVNQYGETMRLYSDVLKGKVVVINVFFSKCGNTCPVMLATYQKLQDHLGDRLERDVRLISLTVDPDNDSWRSLGDYAGRLKARRGWYFLTGSGEAVELALKKLGQAVNHREEHSNIFLIGNDRTGLWKKVQGLAPADQIIAVLDGVVADRG